MTSTHTLPPNLIQSICGPGDQAEIDLLQSGQLSRRLVQLRAILDLATETAPEAADLAHLQENFAALATIQRRSPMTVARLLAGPQAGAWAARCLRHLLHPTSPTPLWIHLAHLGSLAATAAIQSKLDIQTHVPARAGVVCLPTLGQASLNHPEPWSLATCTPGEPALLNGSPPRHWRSIRLLRTGTLSIPLDDTDLYWDCFGLPISRDLDDTEIGRWQRHLDAAWSILAARHGEWQPTMAAAIRCLVPVEQSGRLGGMSASSADAPGAVALTEPTGPDRLAATLIHEVQHSRLNAVHDLVPVYRSGTEPPLYSPWRNDPRGASGLLHGTVAFLGVADFWSREWRVAGRGAELTYPRTVRQLQIASRTLNGRPELTAAGRGLVAEAAAAIDRFPHTGIADDVRRLATDLVAHHEATWRLRHVAPDPADVDWLATRWSRGDRITASGGVAVTAAAGGDSPLFRLAMGWVEDADKVRADAADPARFNARYPGADVMDLALLDGDYARAHRDRLAQVIRGSTTAEVWASLSVAHGRLCAEPTLSPLAVRPELVRAAWAQLGNRLADLTSVT